MNIELITDARLFSLARREADLVFRIKPFDEADEVQRKAPMSPTACTAPRARRTPRAATAKACR